MANDKPTILKAALDFLGKTPDAPRVGNATLADLLREEAYEMLPWRRTDGMREMAQISMRPKDAAALAMCDAYNNV